MAGEQNAEKLAKLLLAGAEVFPIAIVQELKQVTKENIDELVKALKDPEIDKPKESKGHNRSVEEITKPLTDYLAEHLTEGKEGKPSKGMAKISAANIVKNYSSEEVILHLGELRKFYKQLDKVIEERQFSDQVEDLEIEIQKGKKESPAQLSDANGKAEETTQKKKPLIRLRKWAASINPWNKKPETDSSLDTNKERKSSGMKVVTLETENGTYRRVIQHPHIVTFERKRDQSQFLFYDRPDVRSRYEIQLEDLIPIRPTTVGNNTARVGNEYLVLKEGVAEDTPERDKYENVLIEYLSNFAEPINDATSRKKTDAFREFAIKEKFTDEEIHESLKKQLQMLEKWEIDGLEVDVNDDKAMEEYAQSQRKTLETWKKQIETQYEKVIDREKKELENKEKIEWFSGAFESAREIVDSGKPLSIIELLQFQKVIEKAEDERMASGTTLISDKAFKAAEDLLKAQNRFRERLKRKTGEQNKVIKDKSSRGFLEVKNPVLDSIPNLEEITLFLNVLENPKRYFQDINLQEVEGARQEFIARDEYKDLCKSEGYEFLAIPIVDVKERGDDMHLLG